MPGWAMGMRLDEVRPSFDVFGLGKLLWAMVSGRSRLLGEVAEGVTYVNGVRVKLSPATTDEKAAA